MDYTLPYLKSNLMPWDVDNNGQATDPLLNRDFLDNEDLICDSLAGDCTTDSQGRYLSSVHFRNVGPDTEGNCEIPESRYRFCIGSNFYELERTEFVRYEVERNGMHGHPPPGSTHINIHLPHVAGPGAADKRARLASSRTVIYTNRDELNFEKIFRFQRF